jgi:signal transduction histidine kinase
VARGLFPVRLEEKGLVAALDELAANASEVFKIHCRFTAEGPPLVVENEIALHLYYIVVESLANAAKHSGGSEVEITLKPADDQWLLTIQDNGTGFSLAARNEEGMGLRILHYRARVIGATLNLHSQPGAGTTVSCLFLPVAHQLSRGNGSRRLREEPLRVEPTKP